MARKISYCCPKCSGRNILFLTKKDAENMMLCTKKMYASCVDCKWESAVLSWSELEKILIKNETLAPIIPFTTTAANSIGDDDKDDEKTLIVTSPDAEEKEPEKPIILFDPNETPKGEEIKFQLVK